MFTLNESQRKMLGSHGLLIARSLLGFLFVFTGYGMFTAGPEAIGGYFASVGVPLGAMMYWPVVILKISAGLALILGYRVGCAAAALILFTLGAFGSGGKPCRAQPYFSSGACESCEYASENESYLQASVQKPYV